MPREVDQAVHPGITRQREHEREVLPEPLIAVAAGQPIDDLGTRSPAGRAQPERRVAPYRGRHLRCHELLEHAIRRLVVGQRDDRERAASRPLRPAPGAVALLRILPSRRTTSARAATLSAGRDTIDPVDRPRARLHRAARVGKRDAIDDPACQPREHHERRGVVIRRAPVLEPALIVEHAPGTVPPPIALARGGAMMGSG